MRLSVLLAVVGGTFSANADWLWWTVDFTYNWGNEGEMEPNPAGAGAEGYDLYLVIKDTTDGSWKMEVNGGPLVNDMMNPEGGVASFSQVDISAFTGDQYVFFVEMVKSTETAADTRYLTSDYTYAALLAAGHIATELEPIKTPWNPAVGGAWHVPEPTSGVLSLIGFGMLMLRRRRKLS